MLFLHTLLIASGMRETPAGVRGRGASSRRKPAGVSHIPLQSTERDKINRQALTQPKIKKSTFNLKVDFLVFIFRI